MSSYAAEPESLWSSPAFLRFMALSGLAHAAVAVMIVLGPSFRFRSNMDPAPIFVSVLDAQPAPEPEPEPAPPPPPEVKPPAPEPEVKPPEPEPPKQVVEENVVIPDVPAEKPKPKKPSKPESPKKKPEKPVDVAELMSTIRTQVDKNRPAKPASGASGIVDPEMAEYYRKVKACLDANWVGAQRFQRRRDLEVEFEVQVGAGGKVTEIQVTRGSGESSLDETAERAIRKCSPLPEAPGGRTTIPIAFNPGDVQ